jgi:benzoyl-CoA reductase/2-hydroxyglutaryl-CoA dehydratase subunit BcrC/BadD/HgdB
MNRARKILAYKRILLRCEINVYYLLERYPELRLWYNQFNAFLEFVKKHIGRKRTLEDVRELYEIVLLMRLQVRGYDNADFNKHMNKIFKCLDEYISIVFHIRGFKMF